MGNLMDSIILSQMEIVKDFLEVGLENQTSGIQNQLDNQALCGHFIKVTMNIELKNS